MLHPETSDSLYSFDHVLSAEEMVNLKLALTVADAVLTDTLNNTPIVTFTVKGTSSGGSAFSGTTPQALERCADQIVSQILQSISGYSAQQPEIHQ